MTLCTECYIQQNNQTLMLFRNKKKNDINEGKWIGLGGKFELCESPEECLMREVFEEAGVTLTDYRLRGVVTFVDVTPAKNTSEKASGLTLNEPMYLFVYTASGFEGEIKQCDEGTLAWIENDKLLTLDLWEGDKLFWRWLLNDDPFFSAKFVYCQNELVEHTVSFYAHRFT